MKELFSKTNFSSFYLKKQISELSKNLECNCIVGNARSCYDNDKCSNIWGTGSQILYYKFDPIEITEV